MQVPCKSEEPPLAPPPLAPRCVLAQNRANLGHIVSNVPQRVGTQLQLLEAPNQDSQHLSYFSNPAGPAGGLGKITEVLTILVAELHAVVSRDSWWR